jgi:hypothetical protein
MRRPDPAARWRGASAALFTATLAIGAHSLADGGAPTGAGVALVIVLAATVGALSATVKHAADGAGGLFVLLGGGQVLGHVVLAAVGHSHGAGAMPTPAMACAHAAAVLVGAVLIGAGSRLCRALSAVVRVLAATSPASAVTAIATLMPSDQPLQWMLQMSASVSHRGPPVGSLR